MVIKMKLVVAIFGSGKMIIALKMALKIALKMVLKMMLKMILHMILYNRIESYVGSDDRS